MKITKKRLKEIVIEEIMTLREMESPKIKPSYNVEWEGEDGEMHRGYVNGIGANDATITKNREEDEDEHETVVVPLDKLHKIGKGNYVAF